MAEFKEVMKNFRQLCTNHKECTDCPLKSCISVCLAFKMISPTEISIQEFEEVVMKGETENVL